MEILDPFAFDTHEVVIGAQDLVDRSCVVPLCSASR